MNIRKFATITVLVLSSFAATNVAPTKAELESMYDKAFREFNVSNYPQALKELDAIDARQPDLAESQNLRGVILMRQQQYDQAEVALQKALATDAKFWNARFNLAEIPFLKKEWTEARKRFESLLQGDASELQGEAAQLIQYKILLTYLLEGKENMVDSLLAKFELTPETPAAHYSNAAIALQHKKEQEAKDLLAAAEKKFSPQLNKLFAESLYEVGWLQKPAGQTRVAVELTTAADRAAKAKAIAGEKLEQAEQAFQQRDLTAARRLVDEADAADPNQAPTINLRGEILLAQKDFDGAEAAFKQASKIDPKFREAQYNLAQIPFKRKEYTKARERFEALFNATPAPGGDKNQAAQIIKFKIFLTLLLEGKDSRAQKMMEQFQFTGDTPALYYAQAAWEFKHNNTQKANDWIVSARKIYSPALNMVFADSFYDLGWIQQQPQTVAAAPVTPPADVAKADTSAPSIEPSPIPAPAIALNKNTKPAETAPEKSPATVPGMEATTANAPQAPASQALAKNEKAPAPLTTNSPSVETPVVSNALPSETRAPLPPDPGTTTEPATSPATSTPPTEQSPANEPAASKAVAQQSSATSPASSPANKAPATTTVATTPATVLAPATIQDPSVTQSIEGSNSRTWLVPVLLVAAAISILLWVGFSEFRRRMTLSVYRSPAPASGPSFDALEPETAIEKMAAPKRIAGGPPQVSLHLKASEPSVRRAAVPFGKTSRPFSQNGGGVTTVGAAVENLIPRSPVIAPEPTRIETPVIEPIADIMPAVEPKTEVVEDHDLTPAPITEVAEFSSVGEPQVIEKPAEIIETLDQIPAAIQEAPVAEESAVIEEAPAFEEVPAFEAPAFEQAPAVDEAPVVEALAVEEAPAWTAPATPEPAWAPVSFEPPAPVFEAPAPVFAAPAPMEEIAEAVAETEDFVESVGEPVVIEPETVSAAEIVPAAVTSQVAEIVPAAVTSQVAEISEAEIEPVAQGQPIPYQVPAFETDSPMAEITKPEPESRPAPTSPIAGVGVLGHSVESPSFAPQVISTEPLAQQPTTPATMPQPNQPTPAPAIRPAPMTGGAPQAQTQPPASGMQTAVQLTFSFEIASLQLTPSFKMGALQLKPTSKIVTMRLAPSQQPQPAMNLQVTFEIATVQAAGGGIGQIRLTPSQQQRPSVISSPAFNIAGLQLLSGADAGAVQLTPSQQGQASVHVTGKFQIATVEFSPSFEIASLVLNSTSKSVSVQLPGAGPSAVEGAPVFEIANVQIGGNGEIGMMQLNAQGAAPKAA